MSGKAQAFDFARAAELRSQIKNKINDVDSTLNTIENTVESCRSWWTGGSEEGFIENFKNTKKKIRKGLDDWLKEYDKLMKEVEKYQSEKDAGLKKALKK
ncbi:MAG: hypothetical protein FWE82_03450 [Defluviitaleaceae bacterium]|nr:hypothetical protein [Defluviitaleaceae bacterium]